MSGFNLSALGGNEGLRRQLTSRPALSHAYLISGPTGAGKGTLATTLAKAMVCTATGEKPCLSCPQCRKVAGGIHPDVVQVRPLEGKRDITVDQIRTVRSDTYIRPNEGERKVYLIEDAPTMNQAAQNALLKVLEEGASYVAFLLLAENAGMLLPTIRSRCETISLLPQLVEEVPPREAAQTLTKLLLWGDELSLMEHCISLEKLPREEQPTLIDETITALHGQMQRDYALAPKAMKAIERLKKLREATHFYVGAGHLWGWMCAEGFE